MSEPPGILPITVRAFSVRAQAEEPRRAPRSAPLRTVKRRYPREALISDWETEGIAQRPQVAMWRFLRDHPEGGLAESCVEEGLCYDDELPQRDPVGFANIQRYAETHPAETWPGFASRILLMPRSVWLDRRLFLYGYKHRRRCDLVFYNALFDVGRYARHWGRAEGRYRGGWSLGFWGGFDERGAWHDRRYHPRLLAMPIDNRRTIIGWGSLRRGDADGDGVAARVVDLHQTVFSLTDRSLTLEGACAAFGDTYEKPSVEYGTLDERLLDYLREDVRHTQLLYRNCLIELRRHEGLDLQAHQLYSPATIGVRLFEAMGLRRPLERFTDIDVTRFGWRDARSRLALSGA